MLSLYSFKYEFDYKGNALRKKYVILNAYLVLHNILNKKRLLCVCLC